MRLSILVLTAVMAASCSTAPKPAPDSGAASAKTPEAPSPLSTVTCKNGGDTRTLEVKSKTGGGFDLYYTKFGSAVAVASGGESHCKKIGEQIKNNLMRSGFTCE